MTTIDDGNDRFYRDNAAAYAGRTRRTHLRHGSTSSSQG
ncbi:hypothetical protein ABIE77_004710 [Sinorhizobium fredii]